MIREAICKKCGEAFTPADDDDLEHLVRMVDEQPCGGEGEMVRVMYHPEELLDFDAIVAALLAAGLDAYVMADDDGSAAILAGEDHGIFTVRAGPGWFLGPGSLRPQGTWREFFVGPKNEQRLDRLVEVRSQAEAIAAITKACRGSDFLDLDEIVASVKAAGVDAYVEQTGGGVATIYAGKPDAEGVYPVAAGPGWFEGPNWTKGRATTAEFWIGPPHEEDSAKLTEVDSQDAAVAAIVKACKAS